MQPGTGLSEGLQKPATPACAVFIGGQWFTVVGILDPVFLAPELDSSALMGFPVARSLFGNDASAETIYFRSSPDQVVYPAIRAAGISPTEALRSV